MLAVANLFCERDERVLFSDLHFCVAKGQVLQVQGANGSGKTTLLRILCGLNPDYRGQITWHGVDVAKSKADFLQQLFYLGHSPAINKTLSPMQNLRWFCASRGFADDDAILAVMAAQGMSGYEDIPCFQMSAGQQRRVSLARLQLSAARLWILDEPFTALDKQGVADLEQAISDFAKSGGSVLLTTHHDLQLACELSVINLDPVRGIAV